MDVVLSDSVSPLLLLSASPFLNTKLPGFYFITLHDDSQEEFVKVGTASIHPNSRIKHWLGKLHTAPARSPWESELECYEYC